MIRDGASNPRLLLAIAICVAGMVLAGRVLLRSSPEEPRPVPEAAPEVQEALSQGIDRLRPIAPEAVPEILQSARAAAASAFAVDDLPPAAQSPRAAQDLSGAFSARLGSFLLHDLDASIADMIARGWPPIEAGAREYYAEQWELRRPDLEKVRLDPTSIEFRRIDPGAIEDPGLDPSSGFSKNCFQVTPHDEEGRPLRRLARASEGLVELRLRAEILNIDRKGQQVIFGLQFTWDTSVDAWRWVRTCVYSLPGSGPFGHISPI